MRAAAALAAALLLGCASDAPPSGDDYLRYSAYETDMNEHMLLRWPDRRMPLKVYLPAPPAGLVDGSEAVLDVVREGFTDWTDAAAPGVPRFEFVESAGRADVPVVWAVESNGEWYIAYCAMDVGVSARRTSA